MISELTPFLRRCRIDEGDGPEGHFLIPGPRGMTLEVVASDGRYWTEAGLTGEPWEHVSVSARGRCPSWDEMEFVKREFFRNEECCMQLHVPVKEHISHHPYVLHIWRPTETRIPQPPPLTVAPPTADRNAPDASRNATPPADNDAATD